MNNREIEQTRCQMCAEHGSCNPKCSLWVLREHGKTCTWSVFAHITPVCISKGQRIAQMLILPVQHPAIVQVQQLSDTQRGNGGFGSTGR